MSVISVYRHFYWTESRLAGQTGHIWKTKEEQARCIKEPPDPMMLTSGLRPAPMTVPPTEDMQRADARYHISHQYCLCGIFGYFSPNYLGLVMASGNGPGAVDHEGSMVFARIRLGGLVDIHGMGARGEYGLIEEAWCDDKDIVDAIAKQYDIPVNKSEYEKQPRTDPILSGEAKIVKMSPMFAGMPEALAMQTALGVGPITPNSVGFQAIVTQKIQAQSNPAAFLAASGRQGAAVASLFGQPLTFKQYMAVMAGNPPPPINPFGSLAGPGPFPPSAPGGLTPRGLQPGSNIAGRIQRAGGAGYAPPLPSSFGVPPAWTSQQMRQIWNAKYSPPARCSAPPGSNCQCGACAFPAMGGVPSAPGIGVPGLWKCPMCGTYEIKATDHTWRKCNVALPSIVPVPGSIGVDKAHKPGIIARFKRAMGF